ncbi:hypothetical protein ACIPLR_25555 [Herbaspirillum huttiense]|uniref:MuF-C-terminal domain-containing protein n=1 Tax=Herbaspirillum huttiense TaxID=863372 RepID=UPI0037F46B09
MEDKNYKTALSVFIKSIKAGTKYHEYSLDVGMTPPVLQHVGVPALPLTISVKILDKCYFQHGVTEATLGRLYDLVANAKSVFKSDSPHLDHTAVDAVVVVTIETKDGNPLLVAVHTNKMVGRRLVNQIRSVYDKKEDVVQKWREKGLVLWDRPAEPGVPATVTPIKPPVVVPVVTVKKKRQFTKN